jgi:hypothetical protein
MDRYEIPHGDTVLYMHPLTAGIKQAFVVWLRPRYILNALRIQKDAEAENAKAPGTFTEDDITTLQTNVLLARQEANGGGLFWTATPSTGVQAGLMTEDGVVKLARLMFPESMAGWSDAQIYSFIASQEAGTAYHETFQMLMRGADPKAKAGLPTTSAAPTDTSEPATGSERPNTSA